VNKICAHCKTPIPAESKYCLSCGADTSDPGTGPRPGMGTASDGLFTRLRAAVLDRYEVKELLGRGGMGAVFLGEDRKLERPVAIKVLPPEIAHDKNIVERFEREARTAAKLDHPNIIPIYSVESHAEFHYIVMKFITGKSLDDIMVAGRMPIDVSRRIVWEAACALGHAHTRGIVHRDVKPANIMIDDSGRAILTDFGISKVVQSATQLTATGQVVGTPHYMSPEQGKGMDLDGRSDQYSLALVAYKMFSGKLPFEDDSIQAVLYKKLFEDPPRLKEVCEDIPDHIAEAIHTALAREPEHRFATMEGFATAIWPENAVSEPDSSQIRIAQSSRSSAIEGETEISPVAAEFPQSRSRLPLLFGLLVVVGAVLGGGWYLLNQTEPDPIDQATVAESTSTAVEQIAESLPTEPAAEIDDAADSTTFEGGQQPTSASETPAAEGDNAAARQEAEPTPTRQEPVRPPAPQVVMGCVSINVAGGYGTVFIDSVRIRDTPLVRYEVSPGEHLIEIRREGFVSFIDTVLVERGDACTTRRPTLRRQP